MSRLLCCRRARHTDMGAALDHPQGNACEGDGLPAVPTMADVIRERKKKSGGAGLGTLRRRIANVARSVRDNRPDRGCEHARFIRGVVSSWSVTDVFLLAAELEAGAALRDLTTQAELAREPQPPLARTLPRLLRDRWWCDVELVGNGWSLWSHRAILCARSNVCRQLLHRYPPSCTRIPLEGAMAAMSLAEAESCLRAIYSGVEGDAVCLPHNKLENGDHVDSDLDIISGDNSHRCTCDSGSAPWRTFGVSSQPLHVSMKTLLESGEMCDAKLVFRLEGGSGLYGFRSSMELGCHRAVLCACSRVFRSLLSRRGAPGPPGGAGGVGGVGGGVGGGAVCVDEKVLPRRFARALLHAAYTDQVDLSLIGRSSSSPSSTNNTGTSSAWSRGTTRPTAAMLDDAFQLYEIASFLEMGIVVQGCEDAIVEALCPESLAAVLRWCEQPHASQWVHRQAMRYLRDEFVSILSSVQACLLPRHALLQALQSPFLQASELAALRAILRASAHHKHKHNEGGIPWHGETEVANSGSKGRVRRRSVTDAMLRDSLQPLLQHIRTEHIPRDHEPLLQLVRRGILPPPPYSEGGTAHAWLGRGGCRPARFFQPYLDELKALLEELQVPEAELARARRMRYMQRIPDTLYMVSRARTSPAGEQGRETREDSSGTVAAARACVGGRVGTALRARVRELMGAHTVGTATTVSTHVSLVHMQLALRAVREMSLPDACAELLLQDMDDLLSQNSGQGWESPTQHNADSDPLYTDRQTDDCCRTRSAGSNRCVSDRRTSSATHTRDNSRSSTCVRREQTNRSDAAHAGGDSVGSGGRLSLAVPDVAMAPNANTHLLTARDYCTHPTHIEYGGVLLQLDLGDGATHTPRPGSRAQRNSLAAQQNRQREREHSQAMSCLRPRTDEDELRAAIELSVIRAYSSYDNTSPSRARRTNTLPPTHSRDMFANNDNVVLSPRGRASRPDTQPHQLLSRVSPSPSTRRHDYRHDYRLEASGYGSASTSRGHSPNYA